MSKSTNYNFGLLKLGGSCLCSILVCPSAIAALAPNSLPDSNPATPENLSSCQNLAFGSFVPDRAPYLTTSSGAKRYSTDTVWTATAADGTTATLRTVRVNDNNISNFITTGNNANIFFVDFEDSQTGFNSPKVVIEEGEPNDGSGDSWDLELEYSSPIGNARLLIGDIDSLITSVAQFKDIVSVEGFLGSSSVVSSNSYAGSILKKTSQGNIVTFQSLDDAGPNPKEDKVANRAVVDYEDAYIDKLQVRYGVGSSLAGVGTQGAFVTSGMSAGCNLSGNVFEDSNGNDLLDTSEPLLDNITVSAYLDDGDGVFEADGSDLLVETQDTTTGAYEFTNLAENEAYWVMVDESDSDLSGYQYHGGNVNLSQINPRLISLTSENVSDVNFPFAIANPNQTISTTSSCQALGGTLSGNNLFTPLDNGTFGFEDGSPDQSPASNPYSGVVSGGNYAQYGSPGTDPDFRRPVFGEYSYVANIQNPRNQFQHSGTTDPVYGVGGRFFASDPNNDTPTLTTTLTGLTPNQFYEYSFWAANSEPSPPSNNNVNVRVTENPNTSLDEQPIIYSTGELPALDILEWRKHTVSFTNGASSSITINLQSTKTGSSGNDFHLDNIELKNCSFVVDYGDAPPSYGDALQTTIPSSPTIYLGATPPDGETETSLGGDDGVNADGDDSTDSGIDDEDAFIALNNVPSSGTYDLDNIPVRNTSNEDVTLHAWIDFDRDGKFSLGEYQSVTVANGETTADLSWTVPNSTTLGMTYARFRIAPDVLLTDDPNTADVDERSKDAAVNGEVEDYRVAIVSTNIIPSTVSCPADYDLKTFYWDDNTASSNATTEILLWPPLSRTNSYNINGNLLEATLTESKTNDTFANTNTFRNTFDPPGSGLQWQMDSDSTSQSETFNLDFDYPLAVSQFVIIDIDASNRNNPAKWHDEMTFSAFNSGTSLPVTLTPANFNKVTVIGNTAFAADGVGTTTNSSISADADVTTSMLGFADELEIEFKNGDRSPSNPGSHGIGIGSFVGCFPQIDLGDAPDDDDGTEQGDYQTRTLDDGASHRIISGLNLGILVDKDGGTLQNATATADDNDNDNDDDGVLLSSSSLQSQTLTRGENITLDIITQGSGVLNAWIDWNNDGDFLDTDEQIATNSEAGGAGDSDNAAAGIQLNVTVPSGASVGNTFARFRYSSDADLKPTGAASGGEVEDYQIAIAPAPLCPAAKADLWFANDESGSVDSAEFNNALDFIYQISDGFVYDDSTGMKAGITGWTDLVNSTEIVIPITESFGDPGDSGLFSTGNITLNSNSQGIRELYSSKQNSSPGTRLDRATNYLADLITAGNGKRPNTPQVAVILTDASSNFINNTNEGGFFAWIAEANLLRSTEAEIVLILIDEAATAYNSGGFSKLIIDNVVGDNGRVITVPNYADAADSTLGYVNTVSQAICDLSTPVASDPGLLLVKRITAINPDRPDRIRFNDFVDQPNFAADNNPLWPDSDEDPSSNSNSYLRGVLDGGRIKPGDEVEYTIYFLSQGDEAAEQVNICDAVPDHLTFVKDAYGSEVGIALGYDPDMVRTAPNKFLSNLLNDDAGDFYGANTAPPANLCKKIDSDDNLVIVDGENNDNGAIIVRPAASLEPDTSSGQPPTSLPSAISPGQPAGSYGFIRFRGRVK